MQQSKDTKVVSLVKNHIRTITVSIFFDKIQSAVNEGPNHIAPISRLIWALVNHVDSKQIYWNLFYKVVHYRTVSDIRQDCGIIKF